MISILSNIKLIAAGSVVFLAVGATTYFYIDSIQSDLELSRSQHQEALNDNKSANKAIEFLREQAVKRRKIQRELISKYAANEKELTTKINRIDKHDIKKIIKNKPNWFGRIITKSYNKRMLQLQSDSQAFYNKTRKERSTKASTNKN